MAKYKKKSDDAIRCPLEYGAWSCYSGLITEQGKCIYKKDQSALWEIVRWKSEE